MIVACVPAAPVQIREWPTPGPGKLHDTTISEATDNLKMRDGITK